MNKLDFLPPPTVRRADAQAANASASATNGAEPGGPAESEAFGTVLQGVSNRNGTGARREGVAAPQPETEETATPKAATSSGSDGAMADLLQAIAPDTAIADAQSSQGSAAYSLLEGLLPRILGQNSPGKKADGSGSGSGAPGAGTLLPGMGFDPGVVLNSPSSPVVRVSVQHQETHFRPVIDGLTTKVVDQEGDTPANEMLPGEDGLPVSLLKGAAKKSDAATRSGSIANLSQASLGATTPPSASGEERAVIKGNAADPLAAASDIVGQAKDTGQKPDGAPSLPPAMLQRIASAVTAEAQQMRVEASNHAQQVNNAHFLTSAKASESAVRLLNIQLHPADLGLITVKMRLSGDSLEMQIQVSSEETAQLLRNDAEKLSGLLKGSGYRPDMVTIQNGPTASAQPDGSQSQRHQSMSQSQQEAFERGAQQQGGGSQQREQHYHNERKGGRHDVSGESGPDNRSAGGVYL